MLIPGRNKVFHSRQPSVYAGKYKVSDKALSKYGRNANNFGTTDIVLSADKSFNVKDYHYELETGEAGMLFIPVSEYGTFMDADGKEVWASQLIDTYIREKTGLKEKDDLYAFMYYIHPELNNDSIFAFSTTEKVEMGVTHLGAYYGLGVTSNSPPLYHNRKWGVVGPTFGYPCNVLTLSLAGVDQAMLNKNFLLTDKFLNNGVKFPVDYKNSTFRMVDINTCLMFYRDWIMEKDYLRSDKTWFTYCAAHKTLVTTVALNLPHNLNSFKEVYGDAEGTEFFHLFCSNYFALFGEDFKEEDQTDFEPLWKKEGLSPQQIKPFTIRQYNNYDKARRAGKLKTYRGFKPLLPTQATAWSPQFTADVIFDFVDTYADFIDAGAIVSCATIMAYQNQVVKRMAITDEQYLRTAIPILQILMEADARVNLPKESNVAIENSSYYKLTFQGLFLGFGGAMENWPSIDIFKNLDYDLDNPVNGENAFQPLLSPQLLAWNSLTRVRNNWDEISGGQSLTIEDAYDWMKETVKNFFEAARELIAPGEAAIQYNVPPSIVHMICNGMFPKNPLVEMKVICTVMDESELEPK